MRRMKKTTTCFHTNKKRNLFDLFPPSLPSTVVSPLQNNNNNKDFTKASPQTHSSKSTQPPTWNTNTHSSPTKELHHSSSWDPAPLCKPTPPVTPRRRRLVGTTSCSVACCCLPLTKLLEGRRLRRRQRRQHQPLRRGLRQRHAEPPVKQACPFSPLSTSSTSSRPSSSGLASPHKGRSAPPQRPPPQSPQQQRTARLVLYLQGCTLRRRRMSR